MTEGSLRGDLQLSRAMNKAKKPPFMPRPLFFLMLRQALMLKPISTLGCHAMTTNSLLSDMEYKKLQVLCVMLYVEM